MSLSNIKVNNSTVIGADEQPTAGSDNLVKSEGVFNFRSIIRLTLYTGGSLDSLTDGQYGYNNVVKVLRYKKGNTNVDLTLSYHCLYIYNNHFFKYNGTVLEEIIDTDKLNLSIINVKTLLNNLLQLRNGTIDPSYGTDWTDSDVRVRTGYLAGPFTITLNNEYLLYDAFKYDKDTLEFKGGSSTVEVNSNTYTADDSEVVRFSIKKGYNNQPLSSNDDIINSFINGYVREPFEKAVESLNEKGNSLVIDSFIIESGGITNHGQDADSATRLRTKNFISGNIKVTVPDGFKIYMVVYYNEETYKTHDHWSAFDSYVDINSRMATIGKAGCVARLSFSKNDSTQNIKVEEFKNILSLESISSKTDELRIDIDKKIPQPKMVDFDFGYEMNDFSTILNGLDMTSSLRMELCYNLFDKLCALYPSYVEKCDPMASSDTTQTVVVGGEAKTITIYSMPAIKSAMAENGFNDYPEYAKGVQSDISRTITCIDGFEYQVTYTTTPAYKTYLYKFINSSVVNTDINKKRKIFIVSNEHGNETSAPLNLYLFMQQLCTGVIDIPDFYKLRASCDFYIIPNLNGYGCYHQTRCNARRVDINRNYPIKNWYIHDKDTINDDNLCSFSGPNSSSEFETQLVVNLVKNINPDVCIDHHNTGYGTCQLYSALINKNGIMLNQLAQQASVDMAIAYGKNFPEYFGMGYNDVIFGPNTDSPGYPVNTYMPHSYCWWNEYGIKLPVLIEIGASIQWRNGEQVERLDTYGTPDFYSISEYSLRIQILRYVQFLLKNYNSL